MNYVFCLLLGLALSSFALAEDGVTGSNLNQDALGSLTTGSGLSVRADYSYTFDSDFDDNDLGTLSVQSFNASVHVPIALSGNFRLHTGASYRRLDFDSSAGLVPDQMQGVAALISLEYLVGDRPVAGIRSSPGFYFIDDIDGDSFDVPTIVYSGWRQNESLTVIVGGSYSSLRSEFPVIPFAGLIWSISDKVTLNALLPVASLDFQLSDSTTFSVIGEYVSHSVHTGDSLEEAGFNDTMLSYSEIRAGARLKMAVSESSTFLISGGWAFRQEFEFDEPDVEFRTGGAPFVGVSLSTSF